MVGALVVEQAGFLPALEIGHIGRAIHQHRDRLVDRARKQHGFLGQPFQRAGAPGPVLEDGADACHLGQRRGQRRQMRLGPGRVGLDHRGVPEPVDHDAGQAIGLGMDQPVEGLVEQPRPQVQRPGQPRGKPSLIHHRIGVAIQHPGDDPGFHIDGDEPQRPPLGILQHRQRAGRQALGAPVGHQLIGIDPGKAVADRPRLGLGAQAHHGIAIGGGIGHGASIGWVSPLLCTETGRRSKWKGAARAPVAVDCRPGQ